MGSHFDSAIVFHNEISFLVSTFKYVCITIVYKYASPFFSLMYLCFNQNLVVAARSF